MTHAALAFDRATRSDLPSAISASNVSWSISPVDLTSISAFFAAGASSPAAGPAAAAAAACSASAAFAASSSRSCSTLAMAAATSGSASAPSSSGGGAGTVSAHARSLSISWIRPGISYSAYSNSGLHHSASNGQTSTQIPQYMHSEKSIANRSRTLRVRARPPSLAGGTVSLWESM